MTKKSYVAFTIVLLLLLTGSGIITQRIISKRSLLTDVGFVEKVKIVLFNVQQNNITPCSITITNNDPSRKLTIADSEKFSAFVNKIGNCNQENFSVTSRQFPDQYISVKTIEVIITPQTQNQVMKDQNGEIILSQTSEIRYGSAKALLYLNYTNYVPPVGTKEDIIRVTFMRELNKLYYGDHNKASFDESQYSTFESMGLKYE